MSPQKRVSRAQRRAALKVFRQQHTLEEVAAREQLRLLTEMKQHTVAALKGARGFRVFHLSEVLATIDAEIARGTAATQQLARGRMSQAYRLGNNLVDSALATVGARTSLVGTSPEILDAVLRVTNEQLTGVWTELGSKLKTQVQLVTIGAVSPDEAVKAVAATIRDVKTFRSAQARAEAIVRTEVNRTFSLAAQSRLEQSDERLGGGLKKWWLATDDDRTRPSHRAAGERYGPENAIPVDQPFEVGGEKLMEPLDPAGSPENTINCRCRSVPSVEDVRVPADLRLAS